jgi:hypothetical protein
MAAHEAMLAHLGLNPTEEDAPLLFDDLRATLLACGSCQCPKSCMEWQERGDDGPPLWCHQRGTFLSLIQACHALERKVALST